MTNEERKLEATKLISQFSESIANIQISQDFSGIIESLVECKGKIVTTGMGKAGIAMKKFASILCSLGFSATYLHPGEASHGDLGILDDGDILFVASTSGKTREVIEIMELASIYDLHSIIGITSHPDNIVREKSDYILDMGEIKEGGYLGLAPTTSILIMLALTDIVALVAAQEKGFTAEDYSKHHHSGYLGEIAREKARKNIS